MNRFGSSLLHQLTFSHALVAVVLSLGFGAIVVGVVWARARALEQRVLESTGSVASGQLLQRLRRLEETRDGLARALAARPISGTVADTLWLHEVLSYSDVDRLEVFSGLSRLAEAYDLLPGGSPDLATQWLPNNPQVAALLQSGKAVNWLQWLPGGEPSLKSARQVWAAGTAPLYVVATLALHPSWLAPSLPSGVGASILLGDRPGLSWPPHISGKKPGVFAPTRLSRTVVRLDDDTVVSLELLGSESSVADVLAPAVRAGALVAIVSLALALMLGQTLARRLLSPLQDLLEGTAAIARGHLTVRLPVRRHDELGFLTREFNRMADEIRATYLGVISTLAEVVEAKSHYTREHIERVERLAMATAQVLEERGWAKWSSHQKFILSVAAILHDVGKIAIGNDILNKPGPLSSSERHEILSHPDVGANIVERMGKLERAAEIIRACHEHFDGSGYPRGLKGEEIPLEARIILAVDAFDAMTQVRPYSKARPLEEAFAELRAEAGRQFDPVVVEALIEAVEREAHGQRLASRDSSGYYRSISGDSGDVPAVAS
ncbi:MAG: HD-GYP domain-containing protein [Thermoanaerobaculum sp.]